MKKLVLVTALCLLGQGAQAQPSVGYAEARKLYDQFERTLTASALWQKKKPVERAQAIQAATALRERINNSLGGVSPCGRAAAYHLTFISSMNSIVSAGEGVGKPSAFELLDALGSADRFGEHRAACYDQVEALDSPKRQ